MRVSVAVLALIALLQAFPAYSFGQPVIDPNEGRPQVHWREARQIVGQWAFVFGKVVDCRELGRVNFVNFDTERPAEFAGVIFEENMSKFPSPLSGAYAGKIIRLRGIVSTYQDHPQIVLTDPNQIEILDEMPKSTLVGDDKPEVQPGRLTIATYNTLNLFDDFDDPYRADEGTRAKPREELEKLAQSIESVNADVIALQEVENRDYLERFVQVFLDGLGYDRVVLFEGNDTRGIDVALLSRIPIGPVRSHRHVEFPGPNDSVRRFNRDLLAVTLLPPEAAPIEIWIVHLKSNSGGREFSEPVRLAEAHKVRELLDDQLAADPQARFLLMGDFNDTWDSPTLETIVGTGPTALRSAGDQLREAGMLTYNQGQYRSMIDFILCSPAMGEAYVEDSARIIPGSPAQSGSDHNPLSAVFRTE